MAETQATVSSMEFSEWMLFDQVEPIGGRRLDLLFAHLCLTIARVNGAKNVKLEDFRLLWGASKKQRRLTNREIMASVRSAIRNV